jgi:hypothetical protein
MERFAKLLKKAQPAEAGQAPCSEGKSEISKTFRHPTQTYHFGRFVWNPFVDVKSAFSSRY